MSLGVPLAATLAQQIAPGDPRKSRFSSLHSDRPVNLPSKLIVDHRRTCENQRLGQ